MAILMTGKYRLPVLQLIARNFVGILKLCIIEVVPFRFQLLQNKLVKCVVMRVHM